MDGQQGRGLKGHRSKGAPPTAGDRTRCTREKPPFADQTILRKECLLSWVCKRGATQSGVQGRGYVGVATSPVGPWPSVCPITAVSRGLKPTLSRVIPKATSFAS